MSRYLTVIFDLDGTLVDSYDALARALNSTALTHDLRTHSMEEVRRLVGEGIERFLERAFGKCDPAVLSTFEAEYDRICLSGTTLLPSVREVMGALHEQGIRMSVCTNKPTAFSTKILAHLQLHDWLSAVVGPDLAGARKPDGKHVLEAIRLAGGSPDTTLLVGDMPIDVAAARSAGCRVASIATGSSTREELLAAGPDHFLDRLDQILPLTLAGVAP